MVRLALLSPKETIQQCAAGQNFLLYKYRHKCKYSYARRYLFGSVSTVTQGDHSTMLLVRRFYSTQVLQEAIATWGCKRRRKCGGGIGWSQKAGGAIMLQNSPQSKIDGLTLLHCCVDFSFEPRTCGQFGTFPHKGTMRKRRLAEVSDTTNLHRTPGTRTHLGHRHSRARRQ